MIAGIFHQGSGLGNQLHRYVATRVLALDKGYHFGMLDPQLFKGQSFMNLDMGGGFQKQFMIKEPKIFHEWNEKKVEENGISISSYDPEFNFIKDSSIMDGEFQDERYFEHRLKEIDEWLKVKPLTFIDGDSAEDLCVIGFRGGEYALYPDLFLTKEYWAEAKVLMLQKNLNMKFEVHTDDKVLARQFFPDYKIIHDIGINWRSMRYAKYAIIANSSFYILPRLLSGGVTIAPRYWARHNLKVWSMSQNYYKKFFYI